jgi:uncharacterized protein (TIGR00255 family)
LAYSMTGWGSSAAKGYSVNIRGLNSKFKEVILHIPQEFFSAEPLIYKYLNDAVNRGRLDLFINIDKGGQKKQFKIDEPLFLKAHASLKKAMKKAGMKGEVPVDALLKRFEGIVTGEGSQTADFSWEKVKGPLAKAFADFMKMKKEEGSRLVADICRRLDAIDASAQAVKTEYVRFKQEYIKRAKEKLNELLEGGQKEKLVSSDAVEIAERFDVNEEIVRIHSHVAQAKKILQADACGRKMDFLAQELYREINTIGSKINDSVVAHAVVEMKENTDKIREQAQNLE